MTSEMLERVLSSIPTTGDTVEEQDQIESYLMMEQPKWLMGMFQSIIKV
jgi:hypothetical protein